MPRPAPYPKLDGTQNCAGRDTDTFFPPAGTNGGIHREITALDRPTIYGIWGGATQIQRHQLRRLSRAA